MVPSRSALKESSDIDQFWATAAEVVAAGDFITYSSLYHPDAVVVELIKGQTLPVAQALEGWKDGFDETAAGQQSVSLDFRFSQRLHNSTTAHETGIFRYEATLTSAASFPCSQNDHDKRTSETAVVFMHFESLMVKKDEKWMWLMEKQKQEATQEEWNELEL